MTIELRDEHTGSKPDRLIELFNRAKAIPNAKTRAEFLAEACGEDAEVHAKVEELLSAHNEAGSFLGNAP